MQATPAPLVRAGWALALLAATLVAFWPVLSHEFLNIDDGLYVTANPHVQQGLTARSIGWALGAMHAANWHPLTWLSHMLDWQLWGARPRGHHLTSLLLHAANVLLLFHVWDRLTGQVARSAFVAAVFALHPLHVESVAWVAERKDVLSTLFWLLAMLAYERYARRPSAGWYAAVLVAFAAGLAAKPMLVTLPCVLLLLDWWPLRRLEAGRSWWPLWREKIPLFALAAASCVLTVVAQRAGGAVVSAGAYPLGERIANAIVSYAAYLVKTVWPADLAAFYPRLPGGPPAAQVALATLALAAISAAALWLRGSRPWFAIGWLWYLGTLVPVIGIVQVGEQALADRYTYVPLIGIALIAAWAAAEAAAAAAWSPAARTWPGLAMALLLLAATREQVRHWHDSEALFRHALAVTSDNFLAHHNLGETLSTRGEPALSEAVAHYERAIALRPTYAPAHVNLGTAEMRRGRPVEAEAHLREALRLDRRSVEAHINLGILLAAGDPAGAESSYREALRLDPFYAQAHYNLGNLLAQQGRLDEAIEHFTTATRLKPDYTKAYTNLAQALALVGRSDEARARLEQARRLGGQPPEDLLRLLGQP